MLEKQFCNRVSSQTNIIVQNAASSGKQRSQLLSANRAECQRRCNGPEKNVRRRKEICSQKDAYSYATLSCHSNFSTSQWCIQDDYALVGFRERGCSRGHLDGSLRCKEFIRKVLNAMTRERDNSMRGEYRLHHQRLHRCGL